MTVFANSFCFGTPLSYHIPHLLPINYTVILLFSASFKPHILLFNDF